MEIENFEDFIINNYKLNPYNSGGEIFFYPEYLSEIIDLCNQNLIAIIGIEGFELFENRKIKPRLDLIADFSPDENANKLYNWKEIVNRCNYSAKEFFNNIEIKENYIFNFVFFGETEFHHRTPLA